ncbi:MAG: nucleotide pyrophosphohydrolase [Desulfurococcales archaeon]|nr:nucleotide pyrophosphohydrolase [Desulfurococcales archaeon]
MGLDVECMQEAMRRAYYARDSQRGLYATFAWFVEEVGELAEALLGKRGDEGVEEEIADVMAWLLSIANLVGVDVGKAFARKYGGDLDAVGCLAGLEGVHHFGQG